MCVLLVEDEAAIREMVAEELRDAGFEVVTAADGGQAIDIIAAPPTAFTLLVTDMHMPGPADGVDVVRRLRQDFSTVPVIFTTGRPDALARLKRLKAGEFVLPKPYTIGRLVALARQLTGKAI
jgi:DNA-binding response OmpR family regulator